MGTLFLDSDADCCLVDSCELEDSLSLDEDESEPVDEELELEESVDPEDESVELPCFLLLLLVMFDILNNTSSENRPNLFIIYKLSTHHHLTTN
jgi:hypothetical protein